MKAAVLHSGEKYVKIEDVDEPEPGPGQVQVDVRCCGVCGSDIHITVHKTMTLKHYPLIPGHEASGVVSKVGEGVESFKTGDRVVIAAGTSCGNCQQCKLGRENLCEEVGVLGFDCNGAYAEKIVVPERSLVALPEGIPFDEGAILADAVSTPYHAVRFTGNLVRGESIAVIGCGGLGIHGLLSARALEAGKVIAMDIDRGALENAERAGADEVLKADEVKNAGKALKEISGGLDLIVDFSGYYKNVETCMRALKPGGRFVLVGLGRGSFTIKMPAVMIYKHQGILASYGSDSRALPELIELYEAGKINLKNSITSHHRLEELNDCLDNLYHRKGNPIRYIITP